VLGFFRYLGSAGAASIVDFTIAQSLLFISGMQTGLAYALPIISGATAGIFTNFLLSKRFVFRSDMRNAFAQLRTFIIISLSTLALRLVVAFCFVATFSSLAIIDFGVSAEMAPTERVAQVFAMGVVAVYSYFAHKHISFSGGIRRWLRRG